MDPRHPELAVSRLRELMKQYERIEADMGKAMTSAQLAALEREGGLVVQEICLVAPRIHESLMQTSRFRRKELSRPVSALSDSELSSLYKSVREDKETEKEITKEEFDNFVGGVVVPEETKEPEEAPKPKKKKTTKKKKVEEAE